MLPAGGEDQLREDRLKGFAGRPDQKGTCSADGRTEAGHLTVPCQGGRSRVADIEVADDRAFFPDGGEGE